MQFIVLGQVGRYLRVIYGPNNKLPTIAHTCRWNIE
jgi:hypothetical protein